MSDIQPSGYLAQPASGSGRPVLVLHAWWGLNDTLKAFCDRLAASGFLAFAPDLYHGKIADTIPGAQALAHALNADHPQAQAEVAAAAAYLRGRGREVSPGLAVVGFSLGAYYALDLAASHPEGIHSVVLFYGTGADEHGGSRAAYLGHFAENDPFEPAASVEALEASLRKAGLTATIHRYPGTGHWFFEPDRTDAYNQAAAQLAWERTLEFLRRPSTP